MNNTLDVKIITQYDLLRSGCFNIPEVIHVVENAFLDRSLGKVIFPDKVSVIFNEDTQNRINCLPAGLPQENVYGMKWVSVFPNNPSMYDCPNLSAVIILSELTTGFPVAFMEGILCSNLRTAATSAVAAKYLAASNPEVIGFIGAGEQAKSHFLAIMSIAPSIKVCKVASRTIDSEQKFIYEMKRFYPNVQFVLCDSNFERAARESNIIVTAISGQKKILKGDWISPGTFYCHVGGLEDDYSVPLKANKIICDEWEVVKHRTQTISRMFKEGLLSDKDIYCNLSDIVSRRKKARVSQEEFIYFNTVGMSFVDVKVAKYMYDKVKAAGLGKNIAICEQSMFDADLNYLTL